MRARHVVPILLAALAPLGNSSAQAARSSTAIGFVAGGALTYGNLSGGDFSGSKGAVGFDVNAGVHRARLAILLGYDRTSHGHDNSSGDFLVSNLYVEPRYTFGGSARLTPYVAARLGRAMARFEGSPGLTEDASGYIIGVGCGMLWPLGGAFSADAALHLARVSHDYSSDAGGGAYDYSTSEKGNRFNVRVGIRWAPTSK
jgi:hypothetical protein